MVEISKADWKLFRERIGTWQERYIDRLNQEYIVLLSGNEDPSEKFWALEKRITEDRKLPGVHLWLEKKNVGRDLVRLLQDDVITEDDLEGLSAPLKEDVIRMANMDW